MKKLISILILILSLSFCLSIVIVAQKLHSDNGDGTYTNPVIAADFPDPDVIRVDSVYCMVSSTMIIFPGVTILKSYDLVNWEYCSNAVPRFDFIPCYDLDCCNRYSHERWANSLKYNKGTYYLLFITLDEGGFVCKSDKAEGPWEIKRLPGGFYDPGLLLDDEIQMVFNLIIFKGNKYCLINYLAIENGGYVGIDWFQVTPILNTK